MKLLNSNPEEEDEILAWPFPQTSACFVHERKASRELILAGIV